MEDRNEFLNEMLVSISRYCDYQDRCEQEVRNRLKKLGVPDAQTSSIIERLRNEDRIDEARYAISYARGKFRIKNWGKVRIGAELRSRGISQLHINNALEAIEPTAYDEVFAELALKKLAAIQGGSRQAKRKKLWDLLVYRGWEKERVYDKIRELIP